ncbi:MAG: BspA family leucine-rich repeat surface protein [Lactobacillus sp.]|nr:BspA family leucine-rich repeat surface protein [Lactobacillus sp.]
MKLNKEPKYKLRKLTVGLCSVTLMAIFASHTGIVHADEVQDTAVTQHVDATTNEDQTNETEASEKSVADKVSTTLTTLASTDVTDSDIDDLALDTNDKTTAKAKLAAASTDDEKAKIANSVKILKGYGSLTNKNGTYSIANYNKDKGGNDVVLPTLNDFTNLGLSANKVTISRVNLYNLAHIKGLTTLKVSDSGGTISCSDNSLSKVFSAYGVYDFAHTPILTAPTLTSIDLRNFDTSNITDFSDIFSNNDKVQSINMSGLNTSAATTMKWLFYRCNSLTSLDVSGWDTSNVTDMSYMFSGDGKLPTLDITHFKTGKVTDMSEMFGNCKALTSLDLSKLDTSNVTNMNNMFFGISMKTLDLSNFNTSKVTDMSYMFCYSQLENLDLSHFDTSSVTNMSSMFSNAMSLKSLNLSGFNTEKVTDMSGMFSNCRQLESLDLSSFNTKNVKNMSTMFWCCFALTKLNISGFDGSSLTNASRLFATGTNQDMKSLNPKLETLDLKNLVATIPDTANVDLALTSLKNSLIIADPANKDKLAKMGYTPNDIYLKPSYDSAQRLRKIKLNLPTIVDHVVTDTSAYIKNYVDAAVEKGGYAYKSVPTSFSLNMDPIEVVPKDPDNPPKIVRDFSIRDPKIIRGTVFNVDDFIVDKGDYSNFQATGQPKDGVFKTVYSDYNITITGYDADNNPESQTLYLVSVFPKDSTIITEMTVPYGKELTLADFMIDPGDYDQQHNVNINTHMVGTYKGVAIGWAKSSIVKAAGADGTVTYTATLTILAPYTVDKIVHIEEGHDIPEPDTLVHDLPEGKHASWKKPPTVDDPHGVLIIDDDNNEYPVTIYFYKKGEPLTQTEADLYELKVKDKLTVDKGTELTEKDLVTNLADFPENVTWTVTGYDKNHVGDQTVTTTVEFSDGSKLSGQTVVTIKETEPSYTVDKSFTVEEGQDLPNPDTLVHDLPEGKHATWTKTPTLDDPNGILKIDGDPKEYPVTANFYKKGEPLTYTEADLYELKVKDKLTVDKGTDLTEKGLVTNLADFPENVTWTVTGYDKNHVGDQTVTTTVEFSDGSKLSGQTVVTIKDTVVEPTEPVKPVEPTKPTEDTTSPEAKDNKDKADIAKEDKTKEDKKEEKSKAKAKKVVSKKSTVAHRTKQKLPQTGEGIFGLIGLLFVSLGLAFKKQK